MNVGDKIYFVCHTSNFFNRNKLSMTDEAGNTWYRYDRPARIFELQTHVVIGKILVIVEGTIDEHDMLENSYYTDHGVVVYQSDIDCDSLPSWFTDEHQAIEALNAKQDKYAE
jgi:hypothetical protein